MTIFGKSRDLKTKTVWNKRRFITHSLDARGNQGNFGTDSMFFFFKLTAFISLFQSCSILYRSLKVVYCLLPRWNLSITRPNSFHGRFSICPASLGSSSLDIVASFSPILFGKCGVRISGTALYTKSIYALLSRFIAWSLLCYCDKDHCCALCGVTRDLLFTWYIVHQHEFPTAVET